MPKNQRPGEGFFTPPFVHRKAATKVAADSVAGMLRIGSAFGLTLMSVGTTRTRGGPTTSAVGGRTDMPLRRADFRVHPTATSLGDAPDKINAVPSATTVET
jgi:hypothetical protein